MLVVQTIFATWNWCSVAPLTDYINNPIYTELPTEEQYFTTSDKRVYLDLGDSLGYTNEIEKLSRNDSKVVLKIKLNNQLIRKMRLRVWGYSMGEYLYILGRSGLTLKYKTYSIVMQEY